MSNAKNGGSNKAVDGVAKTKQVLLENSSHAPITVAGKLISPGAQTWVDAADVMPGAKKYLIKTPEVSKDSDTGEELEVFDPVEFLARSLAQMQPSLEELDKSALELLKTTESNSEGTPRQNVIDAIDTALVVAHA